jgi:hypothetical protein
MRYCIQPATSTDVAFLAMTINPDTTDWGNGNENEQANRLLRTCASSTQVWAVRDQNGVPHALWGVSPKDDDAEVGCMWLLACEDLEGAPDDFRALTGMVLGEMFAQYSRLENYVDAGKDRALQLLQQVGFTVEAAMTPAGSDTSLHRVWMEAEGSRSVMGAERPRYLN